MVCPTVYYQNVRGLRSKLNQLAQSISYSTNACDVIALTETWLSNDLGDSELSLTGYTVFRCDRSHKTSGYLRGGGVLIAVRSTLKCNRIVLQEENIEQVFVLLELAGRTVIIAAVYLPPSSNIDLFERHCKTVHDVIMTYPRANVYLLGDYNLPQVKWPTDDAQFHYIPQLSTRAKHDIICNFFYPHSLHQKNLTNSVGCSISVSLTTLRLKYALLTIRFFHSTDTIRHLLLSSILRKSTNRRIHIYQGGTST